MCVVDIITAAFLFAQYSIHPVYALLAVASAYVFSGLFAFLQTLAYERTTTPMPRCALIWTSVRGWVNNRNDDRPD
jgi:hypothetical protein